MPQVLDEATKARAKSIQLQGLEFASELSGHLMKHGSLMETLYSALKKTLDSKDPDEAAIKKLIQKINVKMAWFSKAEAGFVRKGYTRLFHVVRIRIQSFIQQTQSL